MRNISPSKQRFSFSVADRIIYLLCIVIVGAFLSSLDYSKMHPDVLLSFIAIGAVSFVFIVFCKSAISLQRMFFIFIFVFFFLAPLQQYSKQVTFWMTLGMKAIYTDRDYLNCNLLILLFMCFYLVGYYSRLKWKTPGTKARRQKALRRAQNPVQPITSTTLFILSLLSLFSFYWLYRQGLLLSNYIENRADSNLLNQLYHIAKIFPVAALLLYIIRNRMIEHPKWNKTYLILHTVMVLIIFFPLSGSSARFVLFGTYLIIISVLFSHAKYKAWFFLLFLIGFGYVFSLFSIFKTGGTLLTASSQFPLTMDFVDVDFDAYQMMMSTLKMTDYSGYCYGGNFLSAALCFIPRSILTLRMESSNVYVARFFGLRFSNLSCPLVSEMYYAFGTFGIMFLSYLWGRVNSFMDRREIFGHGESNLVYHLLVGMYTFVMRGSLLSAWSFLFGFFLSIIFARLVSKISFRFTTRRVLYEYDTPAAT